MKKTQKEALRMKEPYEMLKSAKALTNNNRWTEKGQSKSPTMNQSNWKGDLQNHSEKNKAL